MSLVVQTRYTCERCKSTRTLNFNRKDESHRLYVPENSTNGLFIYSDIHRCKEGILGITNLHIDANNSVRSTEILTLPSERINKQNKISSLPVPKPNVDDYKKVRVTGMVDDQRFRLRILDRGLAIDLIIGDIHLTKEEPLRQFESRSDTICLQYFKSKVPLNENIEAWMVELINILEQLPPTKVGLFIETLRYIFNLRKIGPAQFHLDMLRTILASHQITVDLADQGIDYTEVLEQKKSVIGHDAFDLMIQLLKFLEDHSDVPLQQFTITHHDDLAHLIYNFLLLEQEGLVSTSIHSGK